jgi:hypothetical protein
MTRRHAELARWSLALVFAAVGWRRLRAAEIRLSAAAAAVGPGPVPAPPLPSATLSTAARLVAAGDPFRLDRVPAPIAAGPALVPGVPPPPPPPPKFRPPLAVSGIVGPPWQAMLDGVPDRPTTVLVRPGDVLGQLRVRSIDPNLVVVQGPDTTWRLTVRKPWQ